MSNFTCKQCGAEIIEGTGGQYITGCQHYPVEILNFIRLAYGRNYGGRVATQFAALTRAAHQCTLRADDFSKTLAAIKPKDQTKTPFYRTGKW